MRFLPFAFLFASFLLLVLPCPAPACSLCGGYAAKRFGFVSEYWQAHAVLCGRLANPKLDGSSGTGTTELHVDKMLRPDPRLKGVSPVILPRYLTVLNPKDPPRMIVLLDEKLFAYGGRDYTPALANFLVESEAVKGKPRVQALTFFAKYLDHTDHVVAEEAFLEFAKATDKEVLEAAGQLKPDLFRKLLKDPKLEPERLSLFAFLLGATGNPADVDYLASLLRKPDERTAQALEGVLSGYVLRRPKEGWAWIHATLEDSRRSFVVRWGTVRGLRFLYSARPELYRDQVLHATALMITSGDLADVAIGDLQKWQLWNHTKLILAQYGKPSHSAPIVRNALVRYALLCPQPEARQFVEQLRKRDPKLVRELEEDLAFEQGK
jgi:hypothetical protein